MRSTHQLRRFAWVNPQTPEFFDFTGEVTFVPLEAVWPNGKADFSRRADIETVAVGYTRFRRGDVLQPKVTPTFAHGRTTVANVATPVGAASTEVHVLRAKPHSDSRFLAYLGQSKQFIDEGMTMVQGVGNLLRVPADFIAEFRLPLLSKAQQSDIADFLDRETTQIDAMIEAQEALATIAGERRRAVIHHYVTKGLATGASLKNTPLKWLGEIPEHWEVANIRRHAEMKTGHTPSRSVPEYWVDCDIPWITLADVWQLRTGKIEYIENTDEMVSELGIANSAAELLPAGTVVLSRTASVGFSGIMATPMATSQDYWNWICKPSMLPEYLLYVFRAMEQEFQALRRGSTHQTIYQPVAASFRIPVPPLDEQRQIVEELRQTLRRTDELLEEIAATTALLRERREALITAAVTGRIDPETGIEYPENPETPKES